MSFERDKYGISKLRTELKSVTDGKKAFFIDGFESGNCAKGRTLKNTVYSGGKICTAGKPVTVCEKAESIARAENIIYDIGPGSTLGINNFYCRGRGQMSDTYSDDGKLTVKTITFDKSNDDGTQSDDEDCVCFLQTLSAKKYLFRVVMETDASIAKMGVKLIKQNGVSSYSSKTDIVVSGGKQYAAFSLNVSAEGKYYIGIAPVYEGSDNEVSGYYSADITKLYLYDVADAEENGVSESILISADFDGRYYSLSTVKNFSGGKVFARYEYGGSKYFATADGIFRTDGEKLCVLCSGRHAKEGAFYTIGSGLYFADGDRVLKIYEYRSEEADEEPTTYTGCSYDGTEYTEGESNPLSLYADVVFNASTERTRKLPSAVNFQQGEYTVFESNGRVLSSSEYTASIYNGKLIIALVDENLEKLTVRVRLASAVTDRTADVRAAFYGGTLIDEGEDGASKKLIGFYRDKVYLFSMTGAHRVDPEVQSVSAGDTITALISAGDSRFVFTEKSIKKVIISETGVLSVIPVKNGFGCDVAGSAVAFGDSVYFANTYGGIYFMDKDGETSLDVCRRVSAAVSDEFSAMMLSGKETMAVCSDGKYFLFAGEEALVWDEYEKRPASVLSAPDERKLVWYKVSLEGFGGIVGSGGGEIYYTSGGEIKSFSFLPGNGEGSFESEVLYPEGIFAEKKICGIRISARLGEKATLSFRLDGERQPDEYTLCPSAKAGVYTVALPERSFYGFSVEISGEDFELYGIGAEYYMI